MKPSPGSVVLYVLSEYDCSAIREHRSRLQTALGISENIGNPVQEGDIVPAVIVRVWNEDTGLMNGQAMLDGGDSLWLLSRHRDDSKAPQTWHWSDVPLPEPVLR